MLVSHPLPKKSSSYLPNEQTKSHESNFSLIDKKESNDAMMSHSGFLRSHGGFGFFL